MTFRRHTLLRRALDSVLAQTYTNYIVKIINDDPDDHVVSEIAANIRDKRVCVFTPVRKRGATENFNLVFQETQAQYVSLLEDDNWWEPSFLEEMLGLLKQHPDIPLIIGNERIWLERQDGSWHDTGCTIWPFKKAKLHQYRIEDICGSAKLCNSSFLARVDVQPKILTPETIPVDVTEHFRERLLPPYVLLHGAPLTNYSETRSTARSSEGELWGEFQQLLIGSVFIAIESTAGRNLLAKRLWEACPTKTSPRAVTLVSVGAAVQEARALLKFAPPMAIFRTLLWLARRPSRGKLFTTRRCYKAELSFLVSAPLTRHLAQEHDSDAIPTS